MRSTKVIGARAYLGRLAVISGPACACAITAPCSISAGPPPSSRDGASGSVLAGRKPLTDTTVTSPSLTAERRAARDEQEWLW